VTPTAGSAVWSDAAFAAALLAVDPGGLGGLVVRGGAGPVRDAWLELLRDLLPASAPLRRCPLNIADDRLLGGLDLTQSLASGRPIAQRGVLADANGGIVILPMAERVSDATGARISAVLDDGHVAIERDGLAARAPAVIAIVALDEGVGPEERPPSALVERCAFQIDIEAARVQDLSVGDVDEAQVVAARALLAQVRPVDDALIESLCEATMALGIGSARAPVFALRAARAVAALDGRYCVSLEDIACAARLVLAPRATQAPPSNEAAQAQEGEVEPQPEVASSVGASDAGRETEPSGSAPTEVVIAAVEAALPDELLSAPFAKERTRVARAHASGGGAKVLSPLRGRPVASRSGALRAGERLNVVETLRAAAPWQKLRGASDRIAVRRDDFRIRRFAERRESTTIFVVDASGSAAFQRLAEAKGAIELLLADAYVSRAHVALVSFRKVAAEVLLPPTRSLARARRRLADLPAGGGTPLANGLQAALLLALAEKARGRTPRLMLLTDGRANITADGKPGRARAEQDALAVARLVRAEALSAVHVDTSPRPRPGAEKLAEAMGARYTPLPFANAGALRAQVLA
jgi:magnesium chelatase subunit D